MLERSIACAARSGVITIVTARCPPGMVPLAHSWSRPHLERAVCRASRRVRGNAVVIPDLRAHHDDDFANLLLARFRELLQAELTAVTADSCSRSGHS